jgi:tRNA (guanine37-N1)-methyltransferase
LKGGNEGISNGRTERLRLYIGLLHYPVYNRNHQRIASAITTLDLHDLARLSRTYGLKRFFVITPLEDQRRLAERVLKHWTEGYGAEYNRDRKEAIQYLEILPSLADTMKAIERLEGERPLLVVTDASRHPEKNLRFTEASGLLRSGRLMVLLFGTAWGLDREVLDGADYILDPVEGGTDYNHLSVRTAAAIIVDRLINPRRMMEES